MSRASIYWPVGYAPPGGGGGEPTPDWEENFEYANHAAMLAGGNWIDYESDTSGMSIESDGEGGSMLSVDWPASFSGDRVSALDIRLPANSGSWPAEWWLEFQMMLSATATQLGGSNQGANEWKYMAIRPFNGQDLRFNYDGDNNGSHVYWQPNPVDNGVLLSLEDHRGTWVTHRIHYRNSDKRAWVQQGASAIFESASGAADNPYFFSPTGLNRNLDVAASFTAHYRRMKRYDSDPGWSGF